MRATPANGRDLFWKYGRFEYKPVGMLGVKPSFNLIPLLRSATSSLPNWTSTILGYTILDNKFYTSIFNGKAKDPVVVYLGLQSLSLFFTLFISFPLPLVERSIAVMANFFN